MIRLAPAALLALVPALAGATDSVSANLPNILVPLGAIGSTFAFPLLLVAIVAYARHRNQRLRHETIRLALEKGQPLPPEILDPVDRRDPALRDLRRGLVLVAIGLGVCIYLGLTPLAQLHREWPAGFVPACIGLAYLAAGAIARRSTAIDRPERGT